MSWQVPKIALGEAGLPALLLLAQLGDWSRGARGGKVLRRWGVREPTDEQAGEAMRYLRRRWICYPPLFVAAFVAIDVVSGSDSQQQPSLFSTPVVPAIVIAVLLGTAVADLLGSRPRARPPRRPSIPVWAAVCYGLLVFGTLVLSVIDAHVAPLLPGILARAHANQDPAGPPVWLPWVLSGVCLLTLGTVIVLAARWTRSDDQSVDLALGRRSARVALSLGVGGQAMIMSAASWRLDLAAEYDFPTMSLPGWLTTTDSIVHPLQLLFELAGLVVWVMLATPPMRAGSVRADFPRDP